MNFFSRLPGILGVTAIAIFAAPQIVAALTPQETAQSITVRIDGTKNGSGVIIERKGDTYTVVTNWHVIEQSGSYKIQTADGKVYQVKSGQITRLPGVDLAILQFDSSESYSVAELGDSDKLIQGATVYVAGWADPDLICLQRCYVFLAGSISRLVAKGKNGYGLVYTNAAKPGMSGGAVLDERGRLVGINGQAIPDVRTQTTDFLGIPINTLVSLRLPPRGSTERERVPLAPTSPSAATSPSLTRSRPSTNATSKDKWIKEKLQSIPVFAITDKERVPLVATGDSNNSGRKDPVTGVFISRRDAQDFLEKLKKQNPKVAERVRVTPVALGEIYQIAQDSSKSNALKFAFIPKQQQVDSAMDILRQSGNETKDFEGVPIFVAKAGSHKGYLTIEQNSNMIIPFFFDKEQLEGMVENFKKQKPELASTVEINVLTLEKVIEVFKEKNNPELNQVVLIPSIESLSFLKSLKSQR